jgi:hypothetical protein
LKEERTASARASTEALIRDIRQSLQTDALDRSEMLHCELTLRGLLPTVEGGLELRVRREGEFRGLEHAEHALSTLSANLMWAQLHSHAPLDEMRGRLHEAAECALTLLRTVLHED